VYESKISLLPLIGTNALKPVTIVDGVKNGETTILQIPADNLPGEFVIRFDYKENTASNPYPSEKRIIISNQDLVLWVNPIYCNNADSTWFQKDERENNAYSGFLKENGIKMKMIDLLQNFLLNYDNPGSSFYKNGISEYENRRKEYNSWISEQTSIYKTLFMGSLLRFHHIPQINWNGSESARKQSFRDNYFEGMDFNDTMILKSPDMKEWMDGYVNLYGELATSIKLRDSLFTIAGRNAIEKARKGNPLVYGWMVDYFFKGYESFNIEKGTKMLQPYVDDPNCLTAKRQEINKRLKGMESLVPGTIAPNIIMPDTNNVTFNLNTYKTNKKFILLLFWSATCSHCSEMIEKIYPWYDNAEVKQKLDVVAISIDEFEVEVIAWQEKIRELNGWTHMRAQGGVRSKVGNEYFILSTPVMVLLNAKTKEILAVPESAEELFKYLSQ
jgi:thioredoxin-related protein